MLKYKVKRIKEENNINIEEVCLGGVKTKNNVDVNYFKIPSAILYFFVLIISIGGFLLWFKSFDLQIVHGTENKENSYKYYTKTKYQESLRGLIYDANGKKLVTNKPSLDVVIIPAYFIRSGNFEEKVEKLSEIINISSEEIKNKINQITHNQDYLVFDPILVKKNIDQNEAMNIRIRAEEDLIGVQVDKKGVREYLEDSESLAHVIGYRGRITEEELKKNEDYLLTDFIGKTGLEGYYERELRGIYGEELWEVDIRGDEKKILQEKESVSGNDLFLYINGDLQSYNFNILKDLIQNKKVGKAGSIVVMDADSGGILSLASFPGYDNNLFSPITNNDALKKEKISNLFSQSESPLFFRAISGKYPVGSIIKPLVATTALEEGLINESTRIYDYGGVIKVGKNETILHDNVYPHRASYLNVKDGLAQSSNIFFYHLGAGYKNFTGLGSKTLTKYYRSFGLGAKTNIDIKGEDSGLVPGEEWKKKVKNEPWYTGDTYNISIGQGDILATPLQAALYTSIIANGGTYYKPQLVKEIKKSNGEITKIKKEVIRNNFINSNNIRIVQDGMRKVVTGGTLVNLKNLPLEIKAKTGTAQSPGGGESHSWVTSFSNINNRNIVVTVLIENGGYGSKTAGPIAQSVYEWLINNQ